MPSGAPASAACSTADSDAAVGTHDDRHTCWPSASSTRTECRDAIPRSIPTSRRDAGCSACCCLIITFSYVVRIVHSGGAADSNIHRPRSQGARASQRLPLMCCNRARPLPGWPTSLIRVIRGQASSGNQIHEARHSRRPQNPTRRHLPDQPGMLMQPWNPELIKHRSSLHEPLTPSMRTSSTGVGGSHLRRSAAAGCGSRPTAAGGVAGLPCCTDPGSVLGHPSDRREKKPAQDHSQGRPRVYVRHARCRSAVALRLRTALTVILSGFRMGAPGDGHDIPAAIRSPGHRQGHDLPERLPAEAQDGSVLTWRRLPVPSLPERRLGNSH